MAAKKTPPAPLEAPAPELPTVTVDTLRGVLNLWGGGLFLNPALGTVLPWAPIGMALGRGLVLLADADEVQALTRRQGYGATAAQLTDEVRAYVAALAADSIDGQVAA